MQLPMYQWPIEREIGGSRSPILLKYDLRDLSKNVVKLSKGRLPAFARI